ncbi:hypothetical protein [Nonomuraea sp. NPDC049309]|uniref:hypothetical protein n=1 Tax=Nonomuraea sp. NPDC049309 TaxID=3364350 RepID=UPI0037172A59
MDGDAFVIDSDQPDLTRTIVHARAGLIAGPRAARAGLIAGPRAARAGLIAGPRAARACRNLLLDAGFGDVKVEVHTEVFTGTTMLAMLTGLAQAAHAAGSITWEQRDAWTHEQVRRGEEDRLFLALPLFLASATRLHDTIGGYSMSLRVWIVKECERAVTSGERGRRAGDRADLARRLG